MDSLTKDIYEVISTTLIRYSYNKFTTYDLIAGKYRGIIIERFLLLAKYKYVL